MSSRLQAYVADTETALSKIRRHGFTVEQTSAHAFLNLCGLCVYKTYSRRSALVQALALADAIDAQRAKVFTEARHRLAVASGYYGSPFDDGEKENVRNHLTTR